MKKIFVGNLSFDSSEDDIRRAFEDHGEVASVTILTDRDTGRPRGFGFVEMGSDEQAEQAIAAMDGAMLSGRPLRVNEARPREDRGGGFRSAGGGYRPGGDRSREDRGGGFRSDDGGRQREGRGGGFRSDDSGRQREGRGGGFRSDDGGHSRGDRDGGFRSDDGDRPRRGGRGQRR